MTVRVYGKPDCPDYARLHTGLAAADIAYEFHDVLTDTDAAEAAIRVSGGGRTPVLVLPDGSHLVEPDREGIEGIVGMLSADPAGSVGGRRFGRGLVIVGVVPASASTGAVIASLTLVFSAVRSLILEAADHAAPSVAIDIRATPSNDSGTATTIDLLRGLVQSYTLEAGSSAPAVNVCVSSPGQDRDRAATWRYLDDPDGTMARGATFDIREVQP